MPGSTPEQAAQTMINNMPEKTGKSLDQWLKIVGRKKFEKHGEIVRYLKSDFGIGHGFANLIAHRHRDAGPIGAGGESDLVAAQYGGAKAGLKPVYDALIGIAENLGEDVEVSPKKTYVSLRRSKQFALVQPSTKDRVDVGINLKGVEPGGRLEASGSFNAMVTHRVRITDGKQVDAELERWLKKAYNAA